MAALEMSTSSAAVITVVFVFDIIGFISGSGTSPFRAAKSARLRQQNSLGVEPTARGITHVAQGTPCPRRGGPWVSATVPASSRADQRFSSA